MATFVNQELADICTQIDAYTDSLLDALYAQYKLAYCMVRSQNFHGGSADSYKNYVNTVSIYFINHLMNVTRELQTVSTDLKNAFLGVEPSADGIISNETLDWISGEIAAKQANFSSLMDTINAINRRASQYVGLTSLSDGLIHSDYSTVSSRLNTINEDTASANAVMEGKVAGYQSKLASLSANMKSMMDICYKGAKIDYSKVNEISGQGWYQPGNADVLMDLWAEDPFIYASAQGAVWDDQWAVGMDEETYSYLGASAISGYAFYSQENGISVAEAGGSVLSGEMGFDSEYFSGNASIDILSGSAGAKWGWSDEYKGSSAFAEASVAKLEESLVIGKGSVDLEITGEAGLLNADAFAQSEFTDANNFSFGAGASANVAEASIGGSLFDVPTTNGSSTPLFGVEVGVDALAVGGEAGISSVNIVDTPVIDINVATVDLGIDLGLGCSLKVTIPYINPFGWINDLF